MDSSSSAYSAIQTDTQAKIRLFNKRLVLCMINQCNFRREEALSKSKETDADAYAYLARDTITGQLIAFLESPEANALTSPDEVMAKLKQKFSELQKAGYSQKDLQLIEFNILGYFQKTTALLQAKGETLPGAAPQGQLLYQYFYEQARLTSQPSVTTITTNTPPLFTDAMSGVNPDQAVEDIKQTLKAWHPVGIRTYDKDTTFNNFAGELATEFSKQPVSLKAYTNLMITMNLVQDYFTQVAKITADKTTYPTEAEQTAAIAITRQRLDGRMKPELGTIAACINDSKMIGNQEELFNKNTDYNSLRAIYEFSKHTAIQVECKALSDPILQKQLANINTSISRAKYLAETEYHNYADAQSERSDAYYQKVANYFAMQQKDLVQDTNYFANEMRKNMSQIITREELTATAPKPTTGAPPRPTTGAPPRPTKAPPTTSFPVTKPSRAAKPADYFAAVVQAGIDIAKNVDLKRVIQNGLLPMNKDKIIALVKSNFTNNNISYDDKTLTEKVEASINVFDNFTHYLTKLLMNDPKLIQLSNNLYGNDAAGQPNFNSVNLTLAFDRLKTLVCQACLEFDNFFDNTLELAKYKIPNATEVMRAKGDTSPNAAEWMKSGFLMHIGTYMALNIRSKEEVEQPTHAELMIPQLFSALHTFTHRSDYQDKPDKTITTQLTEVDASSIIPDLQQANLPAPGAKGGKITGIFNQANIDPNVAETLFPKTAPTTSIASTSTATPQATITTTTPPSPPKSTTPTDTSPQGSPRVQRPGGVNFPWQGSGADEEEKVMEKQGRKKASPGDPQKNPPPIPPRPKNQ